MLTLPRGPIPIGVVTGMVVCMGMGGGTWRGDRRADHTPAGDL
jgi:hypothetical protein